MFTNEAAWPPPSTRKVKGFEVLEQVHEPSLYVVHDGVELGGVDRAAEQGVGR